VDGEREGPWMEGMVGEIPRMAEERTVGERERAGGWWQGDKVTGDTSNG
jgi:hypothetical protein